MEKFKIKASKTQLEEIGISYDIMNLDGILKHKYPTGYYCLEVTHKVGKYSFTNDFDIPSRFLEPINQKVK